MREAWRSRPLRRVIIISALNNLATVMLVPTALLAVKRGYGISDTQALFFSIIQFLASAGICFAAGRVINRFGNRRVIQWGFLAPVLLALLWIFAPAKLSGGFAIAVFTLAGVPTMLADMAIPHYFLAVTPVPRRVAGSMLTAMAAGVAAGVLGMVLSGGIFRALALRAPEWEPLRVFKVYYLAALLVLLPAIQVILKLPEASQNR